MPFATFACRDVRMPAAEASSGLFLMFQAGSAGSVPCLLYRASHAAGPLRLLEIIWTVWTEEGRPAGRVHIQL